MGVPRTCGRPERSWARRACAREGFGVGSASLWVLEAWSVALAAGRAGPAASHRALAGGRADSPPFVAGCLFSDWPLELAQWL